MGVTQAGFNKIFFWQNNRLGKKCCVLTRIVASLSILHTQKTDLLVYQFYYRNLLAQVLSPAAKCINNHHYNSEHSLSTSLSLSPFLTLSLSRSLSRGAWACRRRGEARLAVVGQEQVFKLERDEGGRTKSQKNRPFLNLPMTQLTG